MLSKERCARVWLDEPPAEAIYQTAPTGYHRRINVSDSFTAQRTSATIELLVPLGGRFLYGLLGCEMVGDAGKTLDISVQTTSKTSDRFTDSLAGTLDTVWWGLSKEYADAVLDGAIAGISKFGSPSGHEIRFCYAAHGEKGSAVSIFERLSTAVIALLRYPDDSHNDILEMVEQSLIQPQ